MVATITLTSSDAAAMDDRRLLELLLLMMVIHSLLSKEGADDDDAGELKDMSMREFSMTINTRHQSAVSNELLLVVTQRLLLDAQLPLLDGEENKGRRVVLVSSSASDLQSMESAAAAKKKEKAAATAKMKKRKKRNKAAAKHKGTKLMSWLRGGIISLLMMTEVGSITTLSLIHQSYGSSEGKAPTTLPPTSSTSLRHRDLQSGSDMAPMLPSSVSPFAAVVQSPIFSPAAVINPPLSSVDESALLTCFDTPNWKDIEGVGCKWYEEYGHRCSKYGSLNGGNMGVAKDHCCYCGGGSHTLTLTTSPTITNSPTKSAPPSSSPSSPPSRSPTISASPTECFDTPNWKDKYRHGCDWYEKNYYSCPAGYVTRVTSGDMGPASENCCHWCVEISQKQHIIVYAILLVACVVLFGLWLVSKIRP
jgi:hypothetical protein